MICNGSNGPTSIQSRTSNILQNFACDSDEENVDPQLKKYKYLGGKIRPQDKDEVEKMFFEFYSPRDNQFPVGIAVSNLNDLVCVKLKPMYELQKVKQCVICNSSRNG